MSDNERFEQSRAESESRDATVRRTARGPVGRAVQAALTKYLAAERRRERPRPPNER